MSSSCPGVLSPALILLLLLPPMLSLRSFHHRRPGWLDFHHLSLGWRNLHHNHSPNNGGFYHRRSLGSLLQEKQEDTKTCMGAFDLYLILDMSGRVDNNWIHIYNFVEAVVNKFQNSKVRMSFILYSTQGKTLMNLTSDKNEIHEGLNKLRDTVPMGSTNLNAGLQKANEQITKEYSQGKKIPSVIITMIDGVLLPNILDEAKLEVKKSQKMGATIYAVGVNEFKTDQLLELAKKKEFAFEWNGGYQTLTDIVDPLIDKACLEIASVEASSDCVGEMGWESPGTRAIKNSHLKRLWVKIDSYELMISGKGFNNARKKEDIICRYKFGKSKYFDERPTSVEDTSIICPGVKINSANKEVFVEVSLDGGITFINNNISITSKDCTNYMSERREIQDVMPEGETAAEADSSSPLPFNPLYLAPIAAIILLLLIGLCIWRMLCRKNYRRPCHDMTCPTVIVPCCQCRYGRIRRMECKLDALCNFVQKCNHSPMIYCQPRCKKKRAHINLIRPHMTCCPNFCIQPSQECFPLNGCISQCQQPPSICSQPPTRMLPLIFPPTQPYCKSTLPLPPP